MSATQKKVAFVLLLIAGCYLSFGILQGPTTGPDSGRLPSSATLVFFASNGVIAPMAEREPSIAPLPSLVPGQPQTSGISRLEFEPWRPHYLDLIDTSYRHSEEMRPRAVMP